MKGPGEKRSVPLGKVPSVLWEEGEQCNPTLVSIPPLSKSRADTSASSISSVCIETTLVLFSTSPAPKSFIPAIL